MANGWVEACYLSPEFHFTYQYFGWIHPPESATLMYSIVVLSALAALCIGLGFLYRIATIVFFVSFTYLELIEQSWYLNHYYFVSIIAFLLCFIPAHKDYSIDAIWMKKLRSKSVASWTVFILKIQISIVYLFAGIAKLKPDWLLEAMPLKIWLKAKTEFPIVGPLFQYESTAYVFSYFGLLYDLSIPFLLWNKKTRPYAFIAVVAFHASTYALFSIGMFPWIMIAGSLIFISSEEWQALLKRFGISLTPSEASAETQPLSKFSLGFFGLFFAIQIAIPLQQYFYAENVLWTERNYRFSWNVMLMEKTGYAVFTVIDSSSGKKWVEYPKNHLTDIQEKQMSFQPDMIWQYARFLEKKYKNNGHDTIEVYATVYVTLNGRPSRIYLSEEINLLSISRNEVYDYIID
ncbi:type I deoxyribonuclease HsdR [Ulvibacter litoralis]|nr:type I deoxyribonuclease HsdR [Ulvibacter litoralis]